MDIRSISEPGWQAAMQSAFDAPGFPDLEAFLAAEQEAGKTIYPPQDKLYNAFERCPFEQVKVVIVGQDPYINEGQAMGLCFSVPAACKIPPSLVNIYKELARDLEDFEIPDHGDLSSWADQGVFLLNAVLSVQAGESGSHANKGWEKFTDEAISALNEQREGLVFMLWGGYAKKKGKKINRDRHLVLEAGHPSPLSIKHFRECGHFSAANQYLVEADEKPIDWRL